jgi:phosphatidylglycerophosphate synthase
MITPNHLSILGIIHTAISIVAILVAFYALLRSGKIDPATGPGKLYIWLTVITCVTGFPIMKTGHFTPGHYLAIIILILLPLGVYVRSLRIFGKLANYVQVIFLSTTLFLSLIPAVVETLTRLPISQPIANGPNDPVIQKGLSALALLYFVGVIYQLVKLRSRRRKESPPLNSVIN